MMCQDEKSDRSDPGDCALKHGKGGTVEKWGGGLLRAPGAAGKFPEPHEENSADDLLSWGTKLSVLNSDPHIVTSKKKCFFQLLLLALSCV